MGKNTMYEETLRFTLHKLLGHPNTSKLWTAIANFTLELSHITTQLRHLPITLLLGIWDKEHIKSCARPVLDQVRVTPYNGGIKWEQRVSFSIRSNSKGKIALHHIFHNC